MKIIEYKLAKTHLLESVDYAINRLIAEGWQPYGSLVCTVTPSGYHDGTMTTTYIQPMVRYVEAAQ